MQALVEKFRHYLITQKYMSKHTVDAYSKDIEQFLDFLKKTSTVQQFQDISLQHLKQYLKHLRYEMNISPRSSSRKLSALKSLAAYLSHYHGIAPFTRGVTFPKLPKHLPRYVSEQQVQAMLELAQQDATTLVGKRNVVVLCLLYGCGIRVSELVNLQLADICFQDRYIQVLGKGNKERIIPIPEQLLDVLQQYVTVTHAQFVASMGQTTILFPVRHNKKIKNITRQAIFQYIQGLAKRAGLAHSISPHVLRHSLATHLLKKGANLRVLQMLLGHEKLTTVQVYTHMDTTHLRKLYDTFHPRAL